MGQEKRNECRVLGERTNLAPERTLSQGSVVYFQYATPPAPLVKVHEVSSPLPQTPPRPAEPLRLNRYSQTEAALRSSFQRCQDEPSPQDLRIRTLKDATAILNSRAEEVRRNLTRLRGLLADRDTDPPLYKSFQRDRWMQERWEIVVTSQSKTALQHLTSLGQSSNFDPPEGGIGKEDNNLVRFFEISQRQNPLYTRRRCHGPHSLVDIPSHPQRHKHSTLLPLVLKPQDCQRKRPKLEPFTILSMQQQKGEPAPLPPLAPTPLTPRRSRKHSLGTAVIFQARNYGHLSDDLLSEVEGSIPDYAVDLIAAFDADRDVVLRTIRPTNPVKVEVHTPPLRKFPSSWRVSLRSIPEGLVARSRGTQPVRDSGEDPQSGSPAANKTVLSRLKHRFSGIIS